MVFNQTYNNYQGCEFKAFKAVKNKIILQNISSNSLKILKIWMHNKCI